MGMSVFAGLVLGLAACGCLGQGHGANRGGAPGEVTIWTIVKDHAGPVTGVRALKPSGSFGYSLDQLQKAGEAGAAGSAPLAELRETRSLDGKLNRFAEVRIHGFDVPEKELQERLQKVAGTYQAPDLLMGNVADPGGLLHGLELDRRYGLATLGMPRYVPQMEREPTANLHGMQKVVLMRGPHPAEAREIMVILRDPNACAADCRKLPVLAEAAAQVAETAFGQVLRGNGIGELGDKQMAEFDARAASSAAIGSAQDPGGLEVTVTRTEASANERFAAVGLRATVENKTHFGVVFGLVVLRADEQGQWRVLQITPSLVPAQEHRAFAELVGYGGSGRAEVAAVVAPGISQASPKDGELRQPMPELWWDNLGGATLQVVEWQVPAGSGWSASELYFVPDADARLKTRVLARFATGGLYRWRVWSVSAGGRVGVGTWRSFTVQ